MPIAAVIAIAIAIAIAPVTPTHVLKCKKKNGGSYATLRLND